MSIEQISSEQFMRALSSADQQQGTEASSFKKVDESVDKINVFSKTQGSQSIDEVEKSLIEKEKNAQSIAQRLTEAEEEEELVKSLEVINQFIPLKNTNLIFEFDDLSDPPIVKVVDKDTDEVIREIPPKNIRDITKALNDMADSINRTGALFNSEV